MPRLPRGAMRAMPKYEVALPSTPQLRRQSLRDSLLPTIDLLQQRRADQIADGFIADYLALDWLEWDGGILRLTVTGANVCKQLRASWTE